MVDSKRNKKDRGNIENTIEGKWLKQKIDFHLPGNFTDDSILSQTLGVSREKQAPPPPPTFIPH